MACWYSLLGDCSERTGCPPEPRTESQVSRAEACGCEGIPRDTVTRRLGEGVASWPAVALGAMCQHLTIILVAVGLGVSWNTANDVLAEGRRILIADPGRFDGGAAIGVDEHV